MTHFSDKLKQYTERRGVTIVSLAKQLGIDRATLHKIISGERRPTSEQLVQDISRILLLSVDETNELMELYKRTIMGENVYRRRLMVRRMIERLSNFDLKTAENADCSEPPDFPAIKACFNHDELLRGIKNILIPSVRKGSAVRIVAQPSEKLSPVFIMSAARGAVIEQIICFDNSSDNSDSDCFNLDIFPEICTFALFYPEYCPLCYYDKVEAHINSMTLLPVLIVTDEVVVCADSELNSGMIYKDPMTVRFYKGVFGKLRDNCYPFLQVDKDFEQMISRGSEYPKYTLTFDYQPSIVLAADEEHLRHMLEPDSNYAQSVVRRSKRLKERFLGMGYINIFALDGLRDFLDTGLSTELSTPPSRALTMNERVKILRTMISLAENRSYEYRIIKKEYAPSGIRVSLLESRNVKLVSHLPDRSMAFVNVTEQSIVYAFNDYIGYLLSEGIVLSREKTLELMRNELDRYDFQ